MRVSVLAGHPLGKDPRRSAAGYLRNAGGRRGRRAPRTRRAAHWRGALGVPFLPAAVRRPDSGAHRQGWRARPGDHRRRRQPAPGLRHRERRCPRRHSGDYLNVSGRMPAGYGLRVLVGHAAWQSARQDWGWIMPTGIGREELRTLTGKGAQLVEALPAGDYDWRTCRARSACRSRNWTPGAVSLTDRGQSSCTARTGIEM